MDSRLRNPLLFLASLSGIFCLAVIGTAGRSLHVYNNEHNSQPWLLPLWPDHFDSRELQTLIGTSAVVLVLNAILALALILAALPTNVVVVASSSLSTMVMLVSLALSSAINSRAPHRDTLQTWTCRWKDISIVHGKMPPGNFHSLCHQTRFAYYTTIPLFIIQLALLGISVYATFARQSHRGHTQIEKGQIHPLRDIGNLANGSYETKSPTVRAYVRHNGYDEAAKLPEPSPFNFQRVEPNEGTPRSSLLEAVMRRSVF